MSTQDPKRTAPSTDGPTSGQCGAVISHPPTVATQTVFPGHTRGKPASKRTGWRRNFRNTSLKQARCWRLPCRTSWRQPVSSGLLAEARAEQPVGTAEQGQPSPHRCGGQHPQPSEYPWALRWQSDMINGPKSSLPNLPGIDSDASFRGVGSHPVGPVTPGLLLEDFRGWHRQEFPLAASIVIC